MNPTKRVLNLIKSTSYMNCYHFFSIFKALYIKSRNKMIFNTMNALFIVLFIVSNTGIVSSFVETSAEDMMDSNNNDLNKRIINFTQGNVKQFICKKILLIYIILNVNIINC